MEDGDESFSNAIKQKTCLLFIEKLLSFLLVIYHSIWCSPTIQLSVNGNVYICNLK